MKEDSYCVYVDESADRSGRPVLALAISFITNPGVFHMEFIRTFDCSSGTSGSGLYSIVEGYLGAKGLDGLLFHISTDGASAVCQVTGPKKSFSARFSMDKAWLANGTW